MQIGQWHMYANEEYGFSFTYPDTWKVAESSSKPDYPVYVRIETGDLDWVSEYIGGDWPTMIINRGAYLALQIKPDRHYGTYEKYTEAMLKLYDKLYKLSNSDTQAL